MPVSDPRRLNERYNELFAARDLDGLMALYEEDAVLCPAPGREIRGRAEISKRLAGLLALTGVLEASEQSCVAFGDCALLHARWRFVGTNGEGKPVAFGGVSSKLARRGPDGNWRTVIDMPTGGV
ncbi:MAG: nuclear transport factor 2 family protein [Roseiarcus sp.]|jgi:ketosteroid isomerase-like protein